MRAPPSVCVSELLSPWFSPGHHHEETKQTLFFPLTILNVQLMFHHATIDVLVRKPGLIPCHSPGNLCDGGIQQAAVIVEHIWKKTSDWFSLGIVWDRSLRTATGLCIWTQTGLFIVYQLWTPTHQADHRTGRPFHFIPPLTPVLLFATVRWHLCWHHDTVFELTALWLLLSVKRKPPQGGSLSASYCVSTFHV